MTEAEAYEQLRAAVAACPTIETLRDYANAQYKVGGGIMLILETERDVFVAGGLSNVALTQVTEAFITSLEKQAVQQLGVAFARPMGEA